MHGYGGSPLEMKCFIDLIHECDPTIFVYNLPISREYNAMTKYEE
jgi:hypothetical protein